MSPRRRRLAAILGWTAAAIALALGVFAALVNLPIRERPLLRPAMA